MSSFDNHLTARQHIQDHSSAKSETKYWGYPSRVVPCTNDIGTCQYLDGVYWMHTVSMLYTFILWAVIGGILLILILGRVLRPQRATKRDLQQPKQGLLYRSWRTVSSGSRKFLLPESTWAKFFPNTTRLQLLILAVLSVYLVIFSLVGIVYKTWITPVKGTNLYNTRTGLGGFSDRVGALAYALTPLTVALSTRDSILSLLTGIPYQHFNFLHRWTGKIIFVQSFIHTLGWTIIEGKLYQPQPKIYVNFIKQTYIIWGIVAQVLITFLFLFSTRYAVRKTGYEFFRKAHYLVAGVYLGACWGHWSKLACWMIASLGILGVDLGLRILRVCLIHLGYKSGNKGLGFRAIQSKLQMFEDPTGTIIRMEFEHNHEPWKVGQHFFITFPSLSIWQSHPFTPASTPPNSLIPPKHVYIIRSRKGETGELAVLARAESNEPKTTPVILVGPYGASAVDNDTSNLLAIAGGTGISFTLPIVNTALLPSKYQIQNVELVWIIRHPENLLWIAPEIRSLKALLDRPSPPASMAEDDSSKADEKVTVQSIASSKRFRVHVYVTRDFTSSSTAFAKSHQEEIFGMKSSASSSTSKAPACDSGCDSVSSELQGLLEPHPNFTVTFIHPPAHPSIASIVDSFIDDTVVGGRTQVVASGPALLGTDIRAAVAARNSPGIVWKGDETGDIDIVWDDRMS